MKIVGELESDIFFRSSANGWSTENRFMQFAPDGYVCRNVKLNAGKTEFKIADGNYRNVDFGGRTDVPNRYYVTLRPNVSENAVIVREAETTADVFIRTSGNGMSILIR